MKKDTTLKFRISSDHKAKLSEIAKKNKTTLSEILQNEISKLIKKEFKNV